MNKSNEIMLLILKNENSSFLVLDGLDYLASDKLIETTRKINIISTIIVVIVGLIGHSLIIFVFGQKRFRTNSSNVFLLCLAINDAAFLVLHLFEDTINSYKEVFINERNIHLFFHQIIFTLDIADKSDLACRLINYFRDVLRFISSYSLVAFTLQRAAIVYSPFSYRYKSKKSAWITVLGIVVISFIINIWAPFFFEMTNESQTEFCDVKQNWSKEYFEITAIYVFIVTFIPIVLIFSSNLFIIYILAKSKSSRKVLNTANKTQSTNLISNNIKHKNSVCAQSMSSHNKRSSFQSYSGNIRVNLNVPSNESNRPVSRHNSSLSLSHKLKPFYSSLNQIANQSQVKDSIKSSTRILLLVSFVFIILNLPYLITWFLFYNYMTSYQISIGTKDRLFATLQISEIFYVLNYSILFYIYCASGSKFRNQLKYSGAVSCPKNAIVKFYFEDFRSSPNLGV